MKSYCPRYENKYIIDTKFWGGGQVYKNYVYVYIGFFRAGVYINIHELFYGPNASKHHET